MDKVFVITRTTYDDGYFTDVVGDDCFDSKEAAEVEKARLEDEFRKELVAEYKEDLAGNLARIEECERLNAAIVSELEAWKAANPELAANELHWAFESISDPTIPSPEPQLHHVFKLEPLEKWEANTLPRLLDATSFDVMELAVRH